MNGYATAQSLYGGGPAAALTMVGTSKATPGGRPVPTPDMGAAPTAAAPPVRDLRGLVNDPTFWLVATIGAVVYLAWGSK